MRRYKVVIGDDSFVVRGLTRKECQTLLRRFQETPALLEIKACQIATLEPSDYNWEYSLAGVVTSLFEVVWNLSGMSQEEGSYLNKYVNEATEWLMDTQGKQEAISLACVPGLTLELLHGADPPDYVKYLWLGQFACEAIFGIPVDKLLSPPPVAKGPSDPHAEGQHSIRSTRVPNSPPPSPPSGEEDYTSLIDKLPPEFFKPH